MPRGRFQATHSFIEIVRKTLEDSGLQPDLGVNERPRAGCSRRRARESARSAVSAASRPQRHRG
jgi:hypothetical protein